MKIAIHGPMCSGKSTIAKIIQDYDDEYNIYSFGGKIKEIAKDLFEMNGKDRTLLISIAEKMREIDEDIWAKYTIKQTQNKRNKIYPLKFSSNTGYCKKSIIWNYFFLNKKKYSDISINQ